MNHRVFHRIPFSPGRQSPAEINLRRNGSAQIMDLLDVFAPVVMITTIMFLIVVFWWLVSLLFVLSIIISILMISVIVIRIINYH